MSYTVVYERDDDGYWTASVKEVAGCHTQGRSIEQARSRIREALSLFVDDAADSELKSSYKIPGGVSGVIRRAVIARQKAEALESAASRYMRDAIAELRARNVSVRDASAMLGLSHQRIQQIARPKRSKKSRSKRDVG